MAIKCGRGPHFHETLLDVRACYNGEDVEAKPVTGPVSTIVAEEPDATEKQIAFVCSLADQKLEPTEASIVKRQASEGYWGKRSISDEIGRLKALPSLPIDYAEAAEFAAFGREQTSEYLGGQESHRTAQTPVTLEAGMYQMDETIYKVQLAVHGSGNPYAKRLVKTDRCRECDGVEEYDHDGVTGHKYDPKWTFEYAPGAIRELRPEHRMTLEEAKAFGALYGTCCVCGRTLTNETSIEEGIGPICGGRV